MLIVKTLFLLIVLAAWWEIFSICRWAAEQPSDLGVVASLICAVISTLAGLWAVDRIVRYEPKKEKESK